MSCQPEEKFHLEISSMQRGRWQWVLHTMTCPLSWILHLKNEYYHCSYYTFTLEIKNVPTWNNLLLITPYKHIPFLCKNFKVSMNLQGIILSLYKPIQPNRIICDCIQNFTFFTWLTYLWLLNPTSSSLMESINTCFND